MSSLYYAYSFISDRGGPGGETYLEHSLKRPEGDKLGEVLRKSDAEHHDAPADHVA